MSKQQGQAGPEKPADAWGQPISEKRQVELQGYLDRWAAETDHGKRKGPFDKQPGEDYGVPLTGADVFWLVEQSGRDIVGSVSNLHLEGADPWEARLEGANLIGAQLEGARLSKAYLKGTNFFMADMDGADFGLAQLASANLGAAQLERANLFMAHLEGADLSGTQLAGADLRQAHLAGADLSGTWLQGANLSQAHLEGTDLSEATLNGKTTLASATIFEPEDTRSLFARVLRRPRYGPALGDIHWADFDQVQLTQLKGWEAVHRLADERGLSWWRSNVGDYRDAVRAYRQMAPRLRDQGLSDIADRLSDRAQVLQRKQFFHQLLADWRRPWRLPGDLLRWLFSWFLTLLAGYGYHPGRGVFWYLATIAGFTVLYMQATQGWIPFGLPAPSQLAPLPWYEALILSVSSFHGRGFFQPLQSLGDPIAALAAIEAVIGLFIEISFIATFTQRYFGAR
jgi:uncharacterized protein YjbI with pentapeptide repeats